MVAGAAELRSVVLVYEMGVLSPSLKLSLGKPSPLKGAVDPRSVPRPCSPAPAWGRHVPKKRSDREVPWRLCAREALRLGRRELTDLRVVEPRAPPMWRARGTLVRSAPRRAGRGSAPALQTTVCEMKRLAYKTIEKKRNAKIREISLPLAPRTEIANSRNTEIAERVRNRAPGEA